METLPSSSSDVFQNSVTQIAKTASKQRKLVMVGGAIGIALAMAVALYLSKRSARMEEGRDSLFKARALLEGELKAVQATLPKPPAPAAVKGKPAAPAPEASLDFERFAVSEKLPKGVAALEATASSFGGTLPGYEALLLLAKTHLEHGATPEERAKSVGYFERAAESAPGSERAAAAYYGLAFAQEAGGNYAEGMKAFERVLNYGNTPLQEDAMKGLARNQELQKDFAKARETYNRIVSTFPNSEAARFAQMKLADLPGAPADQSTQKTEKK